MLHGVEGHHQDGPNRIVPNHAHSRKSYMYRFMSYGLCSLLYVCFSVVAIYISLRYSSVNDTSNTSGIRTYSPNDSHVLSISNAFCQRLSVSVKDNLLYGFNVSLYLLKSHPQLIGIEYSNFTDQPYFGSNHYQYYYYYLYSGSSINVSACFTDYDGNNVIFYLLKGNDTFNYFKHNSVNFDMSSAESWFRASTQCSSGKNKTSSHTVKLSDYYYFVFYLGPNRLSGMLNISMSFIRTHYVFTNASVAASCTFDTQAYSKKCSVGIPLSGTTALLSFEPNFNNKGLNWVEDRAELKSRCSPRIWMYFVISLAVSVGIVVLMVPFGFVCVILARFKKKMPYEPIPSDDHSHPTLSLLPKPPACKSPTTESPSTEKFPSPLESSPPQNPEYCTHVPAAVS